MGKNFLYYFSSEFGPLSTQEDVKRGASRRRERQERDE